MSDSRLAPALDRLRQALESHNHDALLRATAQAVLAIGEHLNHGEHAVETDAETQRPVGDPEVGGV